MFKNYHTGEMEADAIEQRASQFFIRKGFAGYRNRANKAGYPTRAAAAAAITKAQG